MDLLARPDSDGHKTEQLVLGGRPGTATILATRPTGAIAALTSFAPGARVPVRVDPHDPRSLIVA